MIWTKYGGWYDVCKKYGMRNGKWIALDGRDCNRSDYPELSPYFPVGVFTSTARTLAGAPAYATIAADDTNYLATGVAGTATLQASADGVTWTASSTWGASTSWASIIRAGTRWVIAGSGGDATAPYVQNVNATAANTVPKANWTATTGGTTTTLTQGLAYSPSLGRTVLCKNGSLATASGLFYLNDASTTWNACSGGSTMDRKGVCWTGQAFVTISNASDSNIIQTSSDGMTFSDAYINQKGNAVSITSDGNGTVVVYVTAAGLSNSKGYGFIVSKDHGSTWCFVDAITSDLYYPVPVIWYVNGKFIAAGTGVTLMSSDGLTWINEPVAMRGKLFVTMGIGGQAYKNGVYCFVEAGNTAAITAVESNAKFHLPMNNNLIYSGVGMYVIPSVKMFIKARS